MDRNTTLVRTLKAAPIAALLSGVLVAGGLPAFADTATVTNSVEIHANSGGNAGASVTNGSVSRTVDVTTIVNGEVVTDIHERALENGTTTVMVTYAAGGISANGADGQDGTDGLPGSSGSDGSNGQAAVVVLAASSTTPAEAVQKSVPHVPKLKAKEMEPIPVTFTASVSEANASGFKEAFIPKTFHRIESFFSYMFASIITIFIH